jgi:hypothetical protein
MRVNPFLMPIVLIAALLGTVFVAQAAGQWSTSGRIAIDPATMTAADLKGWMTLQNVMEGLQISQSELYALGNIPADIAPTTALKDLEDVVSVTTLRDALTARLGTAPAPAPTAAPTAAKIEAHATPTPLPDGELLPADQIKGKMSLREVSAQCAVPIDKLIAGLNLPADTNPDTLIKDLVSQGKVDEVTAVQQVVTTLQENK